MVGLASLGGATVESNWACTPVPRERGFPGKDVNPAHAVFAGGTFFRRGAEAIEPMGDAHLVEPDPPQDLD